MSKHTLGNVIATMLIVCPAGTVVMGVLIFNVDWH